MPAIGAIQGRAPTASTVGTPRSSVSPSSSLDAERAAAEARLAAHHRARRSPPAAARRSGRPCVDHAVHAGHDRRAVDLDRRAHAELVTPPREVRDLRSPDQGLRRDAPDVDSGAAERLGLDHARRARPAGGRASRRRCRPCPRRPRRARARTSRAASRIASDELGGHARDRLVDQLAPAVLGVAAQDAFRVDAVLADLHERRGVAVDRDRRAARAVRDRVDVPGRPLARVAGLAARAPSRPVGRRSWRSTIMPCAIAMPTSERSWSWKPVD